MKTHPSTNSSNCPLVLIADDDAEIRSYLSELVTSIGAIPIEAVNGLIALNSAREFRPDLILCTPVECCRDLYTSP